DRLGCRRHPRAQISAWSGGPVSVTAYQPPVARERLGSGDLLFDDRGYECVPDHAGAGEAEVGEPASQLRDHTMVSWFEGSGGVLGTEERGYLGDRPSGPSAPGGGPHVASGELDAQGGRSLRGSQPTPPHAGAGADSRVGRAVLKHTERGARAQRPPRGPTALR